jgi:hypothetical protein
MKLAAAACMEDEDDEDGGCWWWWPWWWFIIPKEMFISCCCSLTLLPPLAMEEMRGALAGRPITGEATAGARRHGLRAGGVRVYISPAGLAAGRP